MTKKARKSTKKSPKVSSYQKLRDSESSLIDSNIELHQTIDGACGALEKILAKPLPKRGLRQRLAEILTGLKGHGSEFFDEEVPW